MVALIAKVATIPQHHRLPRETGLFEFARFEFGGEYELALLDHATGELQIGRPPLVMTREQAEDTRRRINPFQTIGTEWVVLKVGK